MRIAMIAHTEATWTPYFARSFIERGHEVLVITFSPDRVEGVRTEFVGVEPFNRQGNKRLFFTRVPRVRRLLADFRPDLVYAMYFASNGVTAALAWKGPLAVAAVGSDVFDRVERSGLKQWVRAWASRCVVRRAHLFNTVSRELTDELVRMGVPRERVIELPFGVDTGLFASAEDAPRPRATRMICTRKHEPLYDIPTILRALAVLKQRGQEFSCTFTSFGTQLEANRALARELGLAEQTTFTGPLEHGVLPGLLREADVYISASWSDGTSVSLLEAMSAGLLPVVTRIPANLPWVEHGQTGLLFDRERPEQLADALEVALRDGSLRRQAFILNRERVLEEGDLHRNIDRLLEAFERLIHRR